MEVAFENARLARALFASRVFQKAFADQAKYVRAIGTQLVTGVYAYVRDGVLTTAGLRGSSQAELIDAIGAPNQLDPTVAGLFVRS